MPLLPLAEQKTTLITYVNISIHLPDLYTV